MFIFIRKKTLINKATSSSSSDIRLEKPSPDQKSRDLLLLLMMMTIMKKKKKPPQRAQLSSAFNAGDQKEGKILRAKCSEMKNKGDYIHGGTETGHNWRVSFLFGFLSKSRPTSTLRRVKSTLIHPLSQSQLLLSIGFFFHFSS